MTIQVPQLVDDDVTPSSSVVGPPGDPASSPASRSHSHSLRRVDVSSGDSRSGDSVHCASPVSMVDFRAGSYVLIFQ